MNNNIKYAAAFLLGAAAGGAVAYFATRENAKQVYSQMAADDIADMKRHYREKEEELVNRSKKEKLTVKLEELGYLADTTGFRPRDETRVVSRTEPDENVEIFEEESGDLVEVRYSPPDRTEPHLITQDEYDDNDDYDKIEIVYYEGDDTLADEDESEIVDSTNILGDFDPSKFGYLDPSEPDQMLIRNPRLRADYTVIRDPRTYTKAILGFEEPEDKPPIRKMRRHE